MLKNKILNILHNNSSCLAVTDQLDQINGIAWKDFEFVADLLAIVTGLINPIIEYTSCSVSVNSDTTMSTLEKMGKEGWELCHAEHIQPLMLFMIFKRATKNYA